MPQSEFLQNSWIQYEDFILHKNLLCGTNGVLTEYAALRRDERVPEKQKYTTIEPKDISSEVKSELNLPKVKAK